MTLKLITGPATEPVTLTEAKAQARVDGSDEDALLTALIVAAREQAEQECDRALITQTWERQIDAFPCAEIELGMPPVQSITNVRYIDTAGDEQTLDSAAYVLDSTVEPGYVLPAEGYTWPDTLDCANAVKVRFVAGYGSAGSVPESIKAWIKIRVADLYKMRESVVGGSQTVLAHVDRLLDRYRFHG